MATSLYTERNLKKEKKLIHGGPILGRMTRKEIVYEEDGTLEVGSWMIEQ